MFLTTTPIAVNLAAKSVHQESPKLNMLAFAASGTRRELVKELKMLSVLEFLSLSQSSVPVLLKAHAPRRSTRSVTLLITTSSAGLTGNSRLMLI